MSEPKRYAWKVNEENDFDLIEHSKGEFVRYEDYASLKAEVERLTAFTTRTIIPNEELQAENARLKAEVVRLTKVGDVMLSEWASGDEKDAQNFLKALVIWNAAKKGDQP